MVGLLALVVHRPSGSIGYVGCAIHRLQWLYCIQQLCCPLPIAIHICSVRCFRCLQWPMPPTLVCSSPSLVDAFTSNCVRPIYSPVRRLLNNSFPFLYSLFGLSIFFFSPSKLLLGVKHFAFTQRWVFRLPIS